MEFQNSPLQNVVDKIFAKNNNPVHYFYRMQIHVNGETIEPLKLVSQDINRSFFENYCDEHMVEFMIGAGTYLTKIYRNRNFIQVTMIAEPIDPVSKLIDTTKKTLTRRYIGVVDETISDPVLEAQSKTLTDPDKLDRTNLIPASMQLIDIFIDKARMCSVGAVYRDMTIEDAMKSLLIEESAKVKVSKEYALKGVDMVAATHTEVRDHIVIPQGTKLYRAPLYMHEQCGGVYSAGFSYYYSNGYWYVYPAYDVTRYKSAAKGLTIINVPSDQYPHAEKTYILGGDNVTVLATGKASFEDKSDQQALQLGNGLRFTDATKFLEDFASVSGNKAIVNRAKNMTEVISKARKSGNNNVQLSGQSISANSYIQYSELARRNGAAFQFVWEHASADQIYPGMPVRIYYLENEEVKKIDGVLMAAMEYIYLKDKAAFGTQHIHNIALMVFISNKNTVNQ